MANIIQYLQRIRDAIYGEEVRGSIYDALDAMNTESTNAMQYAATAQNSAQASASSAQASAQLADQKANAAAASEQNASASKDSALLSEQNASQSANVATQKAQEAYASKEAAETAETNARAAKDTAELSAQTAQRYSGNPPRPDSTTKTWWIWDATNDEYVDSHIGSEIEGPPGVGVDDIVLVSGDHTPGSSDIYEVQLSDGSTKRISVWNGRNGEGSGDVLGTGFDLVLPVSGWEDGELTVADERLLALSTYKYIIGADDASRAEFLECYVQPKDIRTDGVITFTSEYTPTMDLTVSVVRLELAANS